MTALFGRARAEHAGWLALLFATCAVAGAAAGVQPALGIAVALGIAFVLITLNDVSAGLALFAVLSFLDVLNNGSGGSGASFMKLAGLLLFGSWFVRTMSGRPDGAPSGHRIPAHFTVYIVGLVGWSAISTTWAENKSTAISSTIGFLLVALLFPIVFTAVRRRDQLMWTLAGFVLGAVISTLFGFFNPAAAGTGAYGRLTGGLGDANEQAAVLVAAIPLAVGLGAAIRGKPLLRLAAWLAAGFCLIGAIETLSRGGLIALGAVLVAGVVFGGRWRRWAAAILVVTALGTVVFVFTIAPLAAQQRVTMTTSSGRTDIWMVAWRMVQAQPLDGVGAGNFITAAIHYVQAPGALHSAPLIVDVPHVAHDVYLEVLADLGIPGLLLFVGLVLSAVVSVGRAARESERRGDRDLEILSRCMVLSLVAFMAADVFLSGQTSKQLWLLMALCPAAQAMSRARMTEPALAPVGRGIQTSSALSAVP